MNTRTRCPEPQTLQAFVEGRLAANEREAVLAHLDECEACMSAIDIANELHREEAATTMRASKPRVWWLAAAAAVLLLLAVPALWRVSRTRFGGPSIAKLVAEAPRTARVVEPRLSGGFAWAAYLGPNRAGEASVSEERLKLGGIAAEALADARRDPSAEAQHTAGVAMLLIEQPDSALAMLTKAAKETNSANAWNDLAAAQYAAAIQSGQSSRYTEALAATDRALRADARHAEALFNRALILEQMRLTTEARATWQRYLDVDASSQWANEARARLAKLPETSGTLLFDRDRPRLEQAALANDAVTVREIVVNHHDRTRAFGEAEYLGRWAETFAQHDDAGAMRNLTIARAIGDALAGTTGESLLRDAVHAIDTQDRATLASAHSAYRRGRIAYARQQLADAEPQLRAAATQFGSSPMALVARYYAANTRFDQGEVAKARGELEALLRELGTHTNYIALGAQVRWELALCHTAVDDWSGALPLLTESAAMFRRLGERSHLGFVETLLADTLSAAGRPDEAAATRIRSFALASGEQHGDRLAVVLSSGAVAELRSGRRDPARALLTLAESAARAAKNDSLLVDVLMQAALLEAEDNDPPAALRDAAAAAEASNRVTDVSLRARTNAHAQLARAAANLPSDPAQSRQLVTAAIDFFRAKGFSVQLPLAHLVRARATQRTGGDAARDLEDGIASLEAHRVDVAGTFAGSGVLDAAHELFDDAIGLAVERGDVATAFAYAERQHAHRAHQRDNARPVTITELQQRLAGSGTAVLTLVALPQRVVAITITAKNVAMATHAIERTKLAALIDDAALRELYDVLIRPAALGDAQRLIVIGDQLLDDVPYAALLDETSRPLVARYPIAMAIGATSLTRAHPAGKRALLAIALPSGDATNTAALPETQRELADVTTMYANATVPTEATFAAFAGAAPLANVIHLAGHTERQHGSDDASLVFAGGESASWRTVAATHQDDDAIVVLSACETLRRPHSQQSRALSIGAGFIAAGAAEVIGTLAPISDRDAHALFLEVHRQLAAGSDAASAVRNAQLSAAAGWRAVAVLTTRIY